MGWCILRMTACVCLVYRHKTPGGGGWRWCGGGVWNGWLATRDIANKDCIINSPRPEELKYSEL